MTIERGVLLMLVAIGIFACQDLLSRYLAEGANVLTVVTIRYWAFAVFVLIVAARAPGGLARAFVTRQPLLQIGRGVLLALEVCVVVESFTRIGIVETQALFASTPLIVVALAGPVLGERIGLRRWLAVLAGMVGVLLILRPGASMFRLDAWLVLLGALMFAAYGLMTRLAARRDPPSTSFLYTGIAGAATMSLIGPFQWHPLESHLWAPMAVLCAMAALGHLLYIRAMTLTEASRLQPLSYLQIVIASALAVAVYSEALPVTTVAGGAIVVAAGLAAMLEGRRRRPGTTA